MTEVPLGRGAYKRLYGGSPEVRLLNRWVEANPANLREGVSILARPGTTIIDTFDAGEYPEENGFMRGNYALSGLFDDALFVVCGENLYRIDQDMTITPINGIIQGTGYPEVAWQKGLGYERLWISDGLTLQVYQGTSQSNGTVTLTGTIVNGTDKVAFGGIYYTWGTTFAGGDVGTLANPYVVNPTGQDSVYDPMRQLVLAITNLGEAGVDYSSTITGSNTLVTATTDDDVVPAVVVTIRAKASGAGGDAITLVEVGSALTVSGATLANGGLEALIGVPIPDGQAPRTISQIDSYILVGIADSQVFYWVEPGELEIEPLNFASKESSPDNIAQIRTVGDQVMIIGEKSTENWYATGNIDAPFAPIDGRVYARGAIVGTPVVINDGVILVGDDGRVYSIGFQSGDATDAGWGVQRISNNGIEERIRRAIRREEGLTP